MVLLLYLRDFGWPSVVTALVTFFLITSDAFAMGGRKPETPPTPDPEGPGRKLMIIHTNDLHSHMDHGDALNRGGYAAVLGVINGLKAERRCETVQVCNYSATSYGQACP